MFLCFVLTSHQSKQQILGYHFPCDAILKYQNLPYKIQVFSAFIGFFCRLHHSINITKYCEYCNFLHLTHVPMSL